MPSYRPESVAKEIQVALSEILRHETRDPALSDVTITGVRMSADLRTAKVYVSSMADEDGSGAVLNSLRKAMSFLRRSVAQHVQLRHTPELLFAYDESIAQGARIEQLLDGLNR